MSATTQKAERKTDEIAADTDLAEGWATVKLPSLADINMGQSPPGSTYNDQRDGLPFFQGKADFGERFPTVRVWCKAPKKIARPGDILISVRAPVGPTNIAKEICAIGRGLAAITPLGSIPTELVLYAFRLQEPQLALTGTGSTFTAISRKDLDEISIDVPPLAEQKRIVAKVEELLAQVNASRNRLARVPKILKRFRQSVLGSASSGRLTEDWREKHKDLEPSTAFLKRLLQERRSSWEREQLERFCREGKTPHEDSWKLRYCPPAPLEDDELPDLPDGWAWASVESISTKVVDGVHKTPDYVQQGIPFVTVRNLTAGPGISFDDLNHVIEEDHLKFIQRAHPEKGDILVSKDGTLGVVRAVRTHRPFSIFVTVALIKPIFKEMADYLEIALSSPQVQKQMVGTGSGLQHIHLRDLRVDCVPLPSLQEQQEIVRRLEALLKLADGIEKRVEAATRRAEKLTQAILAKAFRGELVPTEAELARREGRSYEPASALLERIRASRAER